MWSTFSCVYQRPNRKKINRNPQQYLEANLKKLNRKNIYKTIFLFNCFSGRKDSVSVSSMCFKQKIEKRREAIKEI